MVRWLWVPFLVFVLGCADDDDRVCDLDPELRAHAGSNATNCGFAGQGEDPAPVDACVVTAFEDETPFFARYFRQGIDSDVEFGIASDGNGSVIFYLSDSDPSGGSDVGCEFYGEQCMRPAVSSSPNRDPTQTPPLTCD